MQFRSTPLDVDALDLRRAELPGGGNVEQFRLQRARWAQALADQADIAGAMRMRHLQQALAEGAANARGVVALLEWLHRQFGSGTAYRAAAILQDLAENTDTIWYSDLLTVPGLAEAGPLTVADAFRSTDPAPDPVDEGDQ